MEEDVARFADWKGFALIQAAQDPDWDAPKARQWNSKGKLRTPRGVDWKTISLVLEIAETVWEGRGGREGELF